MLDRVLPYLDNHGRFSSIIATNNSVIIEYLWEMSFENVFSPRDLQLLHDRCGGQPNSNYNFIGTV